MEARMLVISLGAFAGVVAVATGVRAGGLDIGQAGSESPAPAASTAGPAIDTSLSADIPPATSAAAPQYTVSNRASDDDRGHDDDDDDDGRHSNDDDDDHKEADR